LAAGVLQRTKQLKPIREFKPGQKVRTQYGQIQTVLFQRGVQVWLVEDTSGWYHPAKLWPVEEPPAQQDQKMTARERQA
jgi:hypothetical protein